MVAAIVICFLLLMSCVILAFIFALARAGNSMAAKIAMIAMTTSNSIKVKADARFVMTFFISIWFPFLAILQRLLSLPTDMPKFSSGLSNYFVPLLTGVE